ncbi:MAG: hypothetical protein P8P74_03730 [Crocinitomicaceae bacterium]|nr:hypothetical protein [Crocinitomicaceae bacterium]
MSVVKMTKNGDSTESEFVQQDDIYQSDCPEDQRLDTFGRRTKRSWTSQNSRNTYYCANYYTKNSDNSDGREYRGSYSDYYSKTQGELWGTLYQALYEHDKHLLDPIVDSLREIKRDKNMSRTKFAEVVVAFVQDIPYTYIKTEQDCEEREFKDYPCLPNQKWGILSPVEFLHTLYGDCDTRTVLLYTLLKKLGYSPKIANSNFYLHSMLLLDVPSSGEYLVHNYKRYYFWETTAPGWKSGQLPPDYGEIKHWEIVLV